MGFHAVPHAIGIVIAGTGPDGELRHILHARSAAPTPTGGELVVAADTVANWVATVYRLWFSNRVTALAVTAIDESQVDGAQVVGSGGLPVLGFWTATPLPSAVSLCVTAQTGLGGRSHRGRFYTWPGTIDMLDTTGNFLATAYADHVVAALNTLRASMATATVPLAVKSNVLSQVTPITTYLLRDYTTDTQTRRGAGRGR